MLRRSYATPLTRPASSTTRAQAGWRDPAPRPAPLSHRGASSRIKTGGFRAGAVLAAVVLVSACASRGGYYKDDGPPSRHPVDIHSIPDAVPRDEPLSKTGNKPYVALGGRYVPKTRTDGYVERGTASWYGKKFHGNRTSSGEKYDMYKMTAAHRTLPLPSYVRVSNLKNGTSVIVRVNDRGPFLHNRLIDLSYAAAYKLDIIDKGTGYVEVKSVAPAASDPGIVKSNAGQSAGAPLEDLSGDAERYYVQFGAFSQSANAETLIQKLQQNGIGFAHIQHSDDGYFKVRSGPFSASSTAEHFLLRGADLGLSTTIVMEDLSP